MRQELASDDNQAYAEQEQRLNNLLAELGNVRFLNVKLTGKQAAKGSEQLRWATGVVDAADWTLSENGLLIHGNTVMTLKPYGNGLAYVYLVVKPQEGVRLTITEDNDSRHRTVAAIEGNQLIVSLQQDELPPQELWRKTISMRRDCVLAIEVNNESVRSWLPEPQTPVNVSGVREQSPLQVVLNLPQNSLLKELQVWPIGPL